MEVKLNENQLDVLRKIAEEEGLTDYELVTRSGSFKGDNYLGVITTVKIKNSHKQLELILKSSLEIDNAQKKMAMRKVYLREIFVYDTIFPEFEKFEKDQGYLQGFSGHAKLYGSSKKESNEFLILEDLKAVGYEMWDRKTPMTEDHVELVFKEYAKFHAISFTMKEKKPKLYEELSKDLNNVFGEMGTPEENSAMLKMALENGLKAVKSDKAATEAMERFSLIAEEFLLNCMKEPDPYSVILHGDCWCNNMLFKYENSKSEPTKVCLIDWQLAWAGSFIMDPGYFLFTCTSKKILADYDKYLKIYYATLCDSLKNLHCDPDTIIPFSAVENSWKKYAKLGVYLALVLLKPMLSDDIEDSNTDNEKMESGKKFADGSKLGVNLGDAYDQRVLDIVAVSVANNWI